MRLSAPDLLDFSDESEATARCTAWTGRSPAPSEPIASSRAAWSSGACAFVQLYHSTWDDHSDLNENLETNCRMTDQPCAALIKDLKQRGLLDETLVIWGGEFSSTPMNEVRRGNTPGKEGRDHHPFSFSMWMVSGGQARQQSSARPMNSHAITRDPIHVHDLHATLLHCLGVDHTKLTYRHQGRNYRLTDVAGNVKQQLMA